MRVSWFAMSQSRTSSHRLRRACAVLTVATAVATAAHAAPMGFKDSQMAMGDFSPNWRETWVNHAFTARDAIGAGALWMRSDDRERVRRAAEVTYTRLVSRWNMPEAQANVWFVGGLGVIRRSERGHDFGGTRTLVAPGLALDYETRRVYLAAFGRLYRASGLNHDFGSVRAGFSFWTVEYDQTQPWLILEARRMHALSDQIEVTPMLRLIHNRYFVELGANRDGDLRFNFMYIF